MSKTLFIAKIIISFVLLLINPRFLFSFPGLIIFLSQKCQYSIIQALPFCWLKMTYLRKINYTVMVNPRAYTDVMPHERDQAYAPVAGHILGMAGSLNLQAIAEG